MNKLNKIIIKTEHFKEVSIHTQYLGDMQNRSGDYGSIVYDKTPTEISVICDEELSDETLLNTADWVANNLDDIIEASLSSLIDQYNEFRAIILPNLEGEDCLPLPGVTSYQELKPLCGIVSMHAHGISESGYFIIGVELGCNWEEEHGAGVLLDGFIVTDTGSAETAF